jgi:hypothetical protein
MSTSETDPAPRERRRLGGLWAVAVAVVCVAGLSSLKVPPVHAGLPGSLADSVSTCGSPGAPSAEPSEQPSATPSANPCPPTSVAQLGDSIASGEGTLYGYTYDAGTQRWNAPATPDPAWLGQYPLCHDSPDAYGVLVAQDLGTTAPLNQFACTGASYLNGITEPETEQAPNGTSIQDRPAELGPPGGPFNPAFTAAAPDVVLVTFGADDVQFVKIVQSCVLSQKENPGLSRQVAGTNCLPCLQASGRGVCVPGGDTFQRDFTDELPKLNTYYGQLVDAIDEAAAPENPPLIVFTDYMNPFPAQGLCPDTFPLTEDQVKFLSMQLGVLNSDIKADVTALEPSHPNVGFAEISNVVAGHTWCSTDPWDYGLSIYTKSAIASAALYGLSRGHFGQPLSPAPFHPTPEGQDAIANVVLSVVQQLQASVSASTSGASATSG